MHGPPVHGDLTDEALMCAFRDGDALAFDELYRRHRGRLYRYLLRQCTQGLAEELAQDCWMRVIGARAGYDVTARFTTWLFRIAHNRLMDYFRSHARSLLESYSDGDTLQAVLDAAPAPSLCEPSRQLEREELARRLVAALEELPAPQREAFLLREEAGLGVEEIALAMGVNRETAKSRLRYACARLRLMLAEDTP